MRGGERGVFPGEERGVERFSVKDENTKKTRGRQGD